jgi:hypothetical protein
MVVFAVLPLRYTAPFPLINPGRPQFCFAFHARDYPSVGDTSEGGVQRTLTIQRNGVDAPMRTGDVQNHIVPEFGHKRVKDIRAAAVEDWIPAMDVAAATKNDILVSVPEILAAPFPENLSGLTRR